MKTSNKLLLGLFALILVAITIGFIYLKVELGKSGSANFKSIGSSNEKMQTLIRLDAITDHVIHANYI